MISAKWVNFNEEVERIRQGQRRSAMANLDWGYARYQVGAGSIIETFEAHVIDMRTRTDCSSSIYDCKPGAAQLAWAGDRGP